MADRVTQIGLETLHGGNPSTRARVSQIGLETLHMGNPSTKGRVSQVGLEVLRTAANAVPLTPRPQMIVWW